MTKTQKTFKIIGIVLACLICLSCIGVDAWWIYIYQFGANKIEDNVIYADTIEATDGTKANIFEVQYYSNANKNGVEMLEIKLSGLTDTNSSAIYSQGLQYVANDSESSIEWNHVEEFPNMRGLDPDNVSEKEASAITSVTLSDDKAYDYKSYNAFSASERRAAFQHLDILSGAKRYNYASSDNFQNDVGSAVNPISENTLFRIQLTEEDENGDDTKIPYAFTFRGDRTTAEILNAEETPISYWQGFNRTKFLWTCNITYDIYPIYDIDFLAWRLFDKVKSMPAGSNQFTLVEMGDWFNYYSVDENSTLVEDRLSVDKTNKVKTLFTSYYGIKITVHADGAMKSSDSMFNTIHGSATFNITPEGVSNGEYFYGRDVITVGLNSFERIDSADGCLLKLKETFINQYADNRKRIVLKVVIDKAALAKEGRDFAGFTKNSGLENFNIQEIYTLETIGGVLVKSEVQK